MTLHIHNSIPKFLLFHKKSTPKSLLLHKVFYRRERYTPQRNNTPRKVKLRLSNFYLHTLPLHCFQLLLCRKVEGETEEIFLLCFTFHFSAKTHFMPLFCRKVEGETEEIFGRKVEGETEERISSASPCTFRQKSGRLTSHFSVYRKGTCRKVKRK